jgi:thiol:disulfide interchange protein DsbD
VFPGFLLALVAAVCVSASAEEEADGWRHSYDEGIAAAKAENKPVLLDFTAEWCVWCRKMEEDVFTDPSVIQSLEDFVCIRVDTEADPRVALAYQVRSLPRFVILNTFGEVTVDRTGYMPTEVFLEALTDGRAAAHQELGANAAPSVKPVETPAQVVEQAFADPQANREEVLLTLLSDPNPAVRAEVLERIKTNKEASIPVLLAGLSHGYLGTRIASREALRALGVEPAPYDPWAAHSEREQAASEWKRRLNDPPSGVD